MRSLYQQLMCFDGRTAKRAPSCNTKIPSSTAVSIINMYICPLECYICIPTPNNNNNNNNLELTRCTFRHPSSFSSIHFYRSIQTSVCKLVTWLHRALLSYFPSTPFKTAIALRDRGCPVRKCRVTGHLGVDG